jgi:hypothetical protein
MVYRVPFTGIVASDNSSLYSTDAAVIARSGGNIVTDSNLTVTTNGSVGIGTTSPVDRLQVSGNVYVGGGTNLTPTSNWNGQFNIIGNGYQGGIALDGTGMWVGHNSDSRDVIIAPNETERLRIFGNGGGFSFKNTSGGNTTIAPTVSASNFTLTLPAATGTVVTNATSGTLLKVSNFFDTGSSTTSTSLVNVNNSNFTYTPVSTSSTLHLIFTFQTNILALAATNVIGYVRPYESTTARGSEYYISSPSGAGGTGHYTPGAVIISLANTSTSSRSFRLYHRTSTASTTAQTLDIYCTIFEVKD